MTDDAKIARIRELNDILRTTGVGGTIAFTGSLAHLTKEFRLKVYERVRRFNDFSEERDPYGERDFGSLKVYGHKVMWKIDYYDKTMEYGSEDPSDPEQTTRVLSIFFAEDY